MHVLVLAHGHPDLAAGGAERAAYALFQQLKASGETRATFLCFAGAGFIGHDARTGAFRGRMDELVAAPPGFDRFSFASLDYDALFTMLDGLCARLKPDVVHIHHYVHWSIDIVDVFDRLGVPVVLTLHEFIPICHRDGQMVKTNGALCQAWSPAECAACFPGISPAKFFLRKKGFEVQFGRVAHFIAPSRFLAGRFEAWGLPADRLSVIDNVMSPAMPAPSDRDDRPGKMCFGFFGQITPYKGLDVLLRAVRLLSVQEREGLVLGIHGANLDHQTEAFREAIERSLSKLKDCAVFFGPYANAQVCRLMGGYDWIVVPSLWWENSPVVIDEALAAGRPIIGSDIGGVREKGERIAGSLFFDVGNAVALAGTIRQALRRKAAPAQTDGRREVEHRDRAALDQIHGIYARAVEQRPAAQA